MIWIKMSLNAVKIRMVIFLSVIAGVCGVFSKSLIPIFLYNPWLNGLILVSFLCGVGLPFWQIQKLAKDYRFLLYYSSGRDLAEVQQSSILSPFLVDSYGESKKFFSQEELQTVLSSVDRRLHERHSFDHYLIGVLVLLGLLGTFWGLTQTISAIGTTIKGMSITGMAAQDSFNQLRAGIQSPLSGMGVAFSSSILGLISSLILGFLDLQQGKVEKDFYSTIEEKLFSKNQKLSGLAESYNGPAYTLALLEQTAESINNLTERLSKIEESRLSSLNITQKVLEMLGDCTSQMQENKSLYKEVIQVNEHIERGIQAMTRSVYEATHNLMQSKDLQAMRITSERILEELVQGQQISTQEIRKEIRTVVKTLSALSEPEEPAESKPSITAAG